MPMTCANCGEFYPASHASVGPVDGRWYPKWLAIRLVLFIRNFHYTHCAAQATARPLRIPATIDRPYTGNDWQGRTRQQFAQVIGIGSRLIALFSNKRLSSEFATPAPL